MEEKIKKSNFKDEGQIFPNHLTVSGCNYSVEAGSFNLSMTELKEIALECFARMKHIEEEK